MSACARRFRWEAIFCKKTNSGASLDAEYLLQTIARPLEVTSFSLHLSGSHADTNDPLIISLWTGSAWSDITAVLAANPSFAAPLGCVDPNGRIRARFTDSVNVSFTYTVSDSRCGTASATVYLTVDPAGSATVGVSAISLTATPVGKNWKATAAVMTVDQAGAPAAGATVTSEWLFNGSPLASGLAAITDSAGPALLTSPTVRTSGGSFTFRFIAVLLPGHACTDTGDAVSIQVP